MKILIIKKTFLIKLIFILSFFIFSFTIFLLTTKIFDSSETILPLDVSAQEKYDFNGDGKNDTIKIINGQNKIDYSLRCNDNEYILSHFTKDKILFTLNNHFSPCVFIHDISRDKIPEIIIQGCKNNSNTCYIFHFNKKTPQLCITSNKNITGILDCNNTKTPQVFFINSKEGPSSIESFMLVNNEAINTSKSSDIIPGFDNIIKYINLVELPYIIDELPDIFTNDINSDDLSILWNLDKNNNSYAFQNAFFYDYEWTKNDEPLSISWRLSFEKNHLKEAEGNNEEIIININLKRYDSSYKISSIKLSK